jgi:2,3-dihydroxybenzoate decarboxylase
MRYIALEECFSIPGLPGLSVARPEAAQGAALQSPVSPDFMEPVGRRLPDFTDWRLPEMDDAGVDVQVLSHTVPGVQQDMEAGQAVEAARAANDYLAEVIEKHPARFVGLAALPLQDPGAAAAELTRAVGQLGMRGALVNNYLGGHFLDEPQYDELWATLESLRVPLYLHPGVPATEKWAVFDGYPMLADAMWGWAATTGGHAMRIVCGGVFDRHPDATLILGHMGEFLPFQVSRFDSRYATFQLDRPLLRKPSEYFGSNVLITTSGVFEPVVLRAAIDILGAGAVMFAVDYPWEASRDAVELIRRTPMTDAERHQVAHGNAERILKLAVE